MRNKILTYGILNLHARKFINAFLAKLGYQIRAAHVPLQSFAKGVEELAKVISVDGIVDIGVAQGTPELYRSFKGKRFLLVEANPVFVERLKELKKEVPARVEMVFCGSTSGTVSLHGPKNGRASSLYAHPDIHAEQMFTVPVETLDTLVERNQMDGTLLVKIDVEGAEMEVLRGSTKTLERTAAVILEISWGRGFVGGSSYSTIFDLLHERGFELFNIVEGGGILEHGRLVHADFVFIKNKSKEQR